jgi:hypothetical protein
MAYERIQCPKCPSSFGQEARFVSHLSDVHGVDAVEIRATTTVTVRFRDLGRAKPRIILDDLLSDE